MKLKLLMAMMVASMIYCSDGYGQGMLGRMMNRGCCDPAPTCCDTPKDNCGCNRKLIDFHLHFSIARPNFCGCGKMGNLFNRGCCERQRPCRTRCNTGCDPCGRNGFLSRLQFGSLFNNGCGCETPVNDSCNQGCGCGLLSTLRGRFSSMGGCGCDTGCNTGCDDGCGGGLLSSLRGRFASMGGCGCDTGCNTGCNDGCNDGCRVRLVDRVRTMIPSRGCGCDTGCNSGCASGNAPAAEGDKKMEPTPGDAQPSASDGAMLRLRATPTAPNVDPSAFVSPHRTISIGR